MKKTYSLILAIFIGLLTVNGQGNMSQRASVSVPYLQAKSSFKTASCIDTVRYPASKLTNMVELDTMSVHGVSAYSQAYHYSGSGTIHGMNAYVLIDLDNNEGLDSIRLVASVYSLFNINASYPNAPNILLHRDTVDVIDAAFRDQPLMFSTPVAVTDSFVLVLELDSSELPSTLPYYGFNGYSDGLGESLSWAHYAGTWYNCLTDWSGAWDSDMLLSPIFEESYTGSYTVDSDTICLGDSVLFTNTTTAYTDSMFYTASDSFSLDLGDATSVDPYLTPYRHTYGSAASYTSQLISTRYGHTGNCVDTASRVVLVNDTTIASFTIAHMGGGAYQFTNTSIAGNIYSWDFGDGYSASLESPSHTYASAGNYTVCLTVTDSAGCGMDTVCQVISFVTSIDDFDAANYVNIYPVPATKYFNVTVPNNYYGSEVIITDVVGQKIKAVAVENQDKIKISTEEMESGIYFVSIEHKGERVFTERIAVKK